MTIVMARFLHEKFEMPAKSWLYPRMRDWFDARLSGFEQAFRAVGLLRPWALASSFAILLLTLLPQRPGLTRIEQQRISEGVIHNAWTQTYLERPSPPAQRMHKRAEGSSSRRF